jgi:hypothetical protein
MEVEQFAEVISWNLEADKHDVLSCVCWLTVAAPGHHLLEAIMHDTVAITLQYSALLSYDCGDQGTRITLNHLTQCCYWERDRQQWWFLSRSDVALWLCDTKGEGQQSLNGSPKWHPISYIVHYFWPEPIELRSNVVYYLGNRVPFGM